MVDSRKTPGNLKIVFRVCGNPEIAKKGNLSLSINLESVSCSIATL